MGAKAGGGSPFKYRRYRPQVRRWFEQEGRYRYVRITYHQVVLDNVIAVQSTSMRTALDALALLNSLPRARAVNLLKAIEDAKSAQYAVAIKDYRRRSIEAEERLKAA